MEYREEFEDLGKEHKLYVVKDRKSKERFLEDAKEFDLEMREGKNVNYLQEVILDEETVVVAVYRVEEDKEKLVGYAVGRLDKPTKTLEMLYETTVYDNVEALFNADNSEIRNRIAKNLEDIEWNEYTNSLDTLRYE